MEHSVKGLEHTDKKLNIVVLGLSITSSWGNGHATTYRSLLKALAARGHLITFFERDVPWYANSRDMPVPPFCKTYLYNSLKELQDTYLETVRLADVVMVGSYVPQGVEVGAWFCKNAKGIKAFYDIDTPVTLAKLAQNDFEYIHPRLIPLYDLYLSFSGGPSLDVLEQDYQSPMAKALYCSVDPEKYFPEDVPVCYDLGYLGTYSADRQPPLNNLMLEAARMWNSGRFVVAGAQYPAVVHWPANLEYISHIPPAEHRKFYCSQRCTLNITRADMIRAGYSPSVRLFEAAACGVPIISDYWPGLDEFFESNKEILISHGPEQTLQYLKDNNSDMLHEIGLRARDKVLSAHTAAHRALEFEAYCDQVKQLQKGSKMHA